MLKIGDVTSTADKNGEWTNGVVAQGLVPTKMESKWYNAVQRELINVVEGAGMTRDPEDDTQVLQAVKKLANGQIDIATTEDVENGTAGKLVDAQGLKFYGRAPGEIGTFCFATPPSGWLLADGSAVSRTTYSRLFTAIGTTFGTGDGSTTFNLPDLRGEFVRGWSSDRSDADPGREIGSAQPATGVGNYAYSINSEIRTASINTEMPTSVDNSLRRLSTTSNSSVGVGYVAVRPRNVALAFFIFAGA